MASYIWPPGLASGGLISIGSFDGGGASADGLTLSNNVLYAQSASGSVPGMVNTGTQTFAGAKTFSGALTASSTLSVVGNITAPSIALNRGTLASGTFLTSTGLATLTGTGAINGSVNIVGTGTKFFTELKVGDVVTIAGETQTINAVLSDTTASVVTTFTGTSSGNAITKTAVQNAFLYPNGQLQLGGSRTTLTYFTNAQNMAILVQDAVTAASTQNGSSGIALVDYGGASSAGSSGQVNIIKARGNEAAPAAVQSGDALGSVGFRGYNTVTMSSSSSTIGCTAKETFSSSARGANLEFKTTPITTNNLTLSLEISSQGSVIIGPQVANATSATDGFAYMPTCAGTPTGTPTAFTGKVAWVYDSTNNIIYVYNGAWKKTAALT